MRVHESLYVRACYIVRRRSAALSGRRIIDAALARRNAEGSEVHAEMWLESSGFRPDLPPRAILKMGCRNGNRYSGRRQPHRARGTSRTTAFPLVLGRRVLPEDEPSRSPSCSEIESSRIGITFAESASPLCVSKKSFRTNRPVVTPS